MVVMDVLFIRVDLLCQGRDFFCAQNIVVDADIVDQAGEETGRIKGLVGTNGETAIGNDAADTIAVFRHLIPIYIQVSMQSNEIINQSDMMPLVIRDD